MSDRYISCLSFMCATDLIYTGWVDLGMPEEKKFELSKMFDNCTIYVHMFFMKYFLDIMVEKRNSIKYKIVSGFDDMLIPYIREPDRDYSADLLLNDENLICWYGVNKQLDHPKIRSIPIGISRSLPGVVQNGIIGPYMSWEKSLGTYKHVVDYMNYLSSNIQDRLAHMRSKRTSKKLIQIRYTVCNTAALKGGARPGFQEHIDFRQKLSTYIENETPFEVKPLVDWSDNIREIKDYKYCLAPPGRGPDTFRAWESLLVGTVPIVFRTTINDLYEDLPVLVLDNFEQLNEQYLNQQYDIIVSRVNYNFEKLFLKYWMDIIKK